MFAGQRESRVAVIKTRRRPATRSVADRAVLTESLLHMVRVGDGLEIRLVAAVTASRSSGKSTTVTLGAEQSGVLTIEGKAGRGVIK